MVPAVTLVAAAITLIALATPRVVIAVRVFGGPTIDGEQAVRLSCVRRALGNDSALPLDDLEVEIAGQTHHARCDDDGVAEVQVALPQEGSVRVQVRRHDEVLADGDARVTQQEWRAAAVPFPAALPAAGALPIKATVDGGTTVLGHPARIALRLPNELRTPGALSFFCDGCASSAPAQTEGGLSLVVTPTFITASLRAERRESAEAWEVRLPVVSGAVTVDELRDASGRIEAVLRAPQVRKQVYVQLQDHRGRRAASTAWLKPDGQGGSFARLSLPHPPLSPPAFLVVSPEPAAASAAALPWPITPSAAPVDGVVIADKLWLDGLAPRAAHEQARTSRMIAAVGALIATGAVLESLLLYERSLMARKKLRAHLAAFAEDDPEAPLVEQFEDRSALLRTAQLIAAVLFFFAVIALVLMGRISL